MGTRTAKTGRLPTTCVLDAVIEIVQQRTKILEAMREALVNGDEDEALEHED